MAANLPASGDGLFLPHVARLGSDEKGEEMFSFFRGERSTEHKESGLRDCIPASICTSEETDQANRSLDAKETSREKKRIRRKERNVFFFLPDSLELCMYACMSAASRADLKRNEKKRKEAKGSFRSLTGRR